MAGFFTRGGGTDRSPSRIEEIFYPAVLADPNVDADGLTALLRDPSPLLVDEPKWDEPPEPAKPAREHTAVRVLKLVALVTAVALLCAAIVAAAFLERQRRGAPPPGVDGGHITGVRALAGVVSSGVTAAPLPAAQRPGGAASSQGAMQFAEGTRGIDDLETARKFYRLIADRPEQALDMLGGTLSDDERRELALAWHEVDRVRVDLHERPDGLLRAVVTMTDESAGRLRLEQVLRVDPPRITEVRLLSSQQLPTGG